MLLTVKVIKLYKIKMDTHNKTKDKRLKPAEESVGGRYGNKFVTFFLYMACTIQSVFLFFFFFSFFFFGGDGGKTKDGGLLQTANY